MTTRDGHVVIENEFGRAVVSPRAGASLRSLRVKARGQEHELLRGGDAPLLDPAVLPHGTGSFIMAPWPNRIPGGLLVTPEGQHTLETGSTLHTIHGLVRDREWQVASVSSSSARFEIDIPEPWPYEGTVAYEARMDGQELVQSLTIESPEHEFPAGVGWHPWFNESLGAGRVSITLDALEAWVLDKEMTPSGDTAQTTLVEAIRDGTRLPPGSADDCFRIDPGSPATLSWPELSLRISSSETVTHVMVYTPPEGGAICVEPQTTCVNAFQLHERGVKHTGTRFVRPGTPLIAATTWSWQ